MSSVAVVAAAALIALRIVHKTAVQPAAPAVSAVVLTVNVSALAAAGNSATAASMSASADLITAS